MKGIFGYSSSKSLPSKHQLAIYTATPQATSPLSPRYPGDQPSEFWKRPVLEREKSNSKNTLKILGVNFWGHYNYQLKFWHDIVGKLTQNDLRFVRIVWFSQSWVFLNDPRWGRRFNMTCSLNWTIQLLLITVISYTVILRNNTFIYIYTIIVLVT